MRVLWLVEKPGRYRTAQRPGQGGIAAHLGRLRFRF
jgi:hypothetical protein